MTLSISVVITSHNYKRFLPGAIESALGQTRQPSEVLVVDDGSTDSSREVVAGYGKRVRAVFKDQGGLASALNTGCELSRGDLVCFLDADDWWLPEKVAVVARAAELHPDAVAIVHRVQKVDAADGQIGSPYPGRLWNGDVRERALRWGGWWPRPPTSGACYRRTFLERVMPIPGHLKAADAFPGRLAPLLGAVCSIPDVLAFYRIHGANMSLRDGAAERFGEQNRMVTTINEVLERLGRPDRVDGTRNFAQEMFRYKSGLGGSLPRLTWLGLTSPPEQPFGRLRRVGNLWRHALGVRPGAASAS